MGLFSLWVAIREDLQAGFVSRIVAVSFPIRRQPLICLASSGWGKYRADFVTGVNGSNPQWKARPEIGEWDGRVREF